MVALDYCDGINIRGCYFVVFLIVWNIIPGRGGQFLADIVFLHGKGANRNAHRAFLNELALKHRADLHCFEAPNPYKGGYSWFEKKLIAGHQIVDADSFWKAVDSINTKISDLGLERSQLILCGHSQGGAMACAAALKEPVKTVISLCGDWPENIDCPKSVCPVKVIWVEGGKDQYLSEARKQSYRRLIAAGADLKYIKDADTEHNVLSKGLLEKL